MSMDTCAKCGDLVDTDDDPAAYDFGDKCRCETCRAKYYTDDGQKIDQIRAQDMAWMQQREYEIMRKLLISQMNIPANIFGDDGEGEKERQKKFDALPSATQFGEIIGWRSWKIKVTDEGPRLQSSYKDTTWPSGVVTSKDGAGNSAQVGSIIHDAGWFAYKTASQLMIESENENVRVGGKVEMWGAVVEHEKGYRAECMRILTLEAIGPRAALVIDELRDFYLKGN